MNHTGCTRDVQSQGCYTTGNVKEWSHRQRPSPFFAIINSPAGLESLAVDRERSRDERERERKTKEGNDADGHGASGLGSTREWEALRAKRCEIWS